MVSFQGNLIGTYTQSLVTVYVPFLQAVSEIRKLGRLVLVKKYIL